MPGKGVSKKLSRKDVRDVEGFRNFSDGQCDKYITQIEDLSFILYQIYEKSLNNEQKKPKVKKQTDE